MSGEANFYQGDSWVEFPEDELQLGGGTHVSRPEMSKDTAPTYRVIHTEEEICSSRNKGRSPRKEVIRVSSLLLVL